MITSIIIDDEPKARVLLQAVIDQYCPTIKVLEQCADLPTGIKAIKKHKPQLIFLDIEMPGHSGLELLDFFAPEEVNFGIIFTTAYNEYALQAFKFSAIDYLLKPIQHLQLVDAVERFKKTIHENKTSQLLNLKENLNTEVSAEVKKIAVPSGQTIHFFKPADIIMIKGEAAYSEIYFTQGKPLLASKNLKHFEDMLKPYSQFFRSHKSYIINRNAVLQYVKSDGGYLSMQGGLTAGLSTDKVTDFLSNM